MSSRVRATCLSQILVIGQIELDRRVAMTTHAQRRRVYVSVG